MIRQTKQAQDSISHHALYLALNASLEVSDRFVSAVDQTLIWLTQMPRVGRPAALADDALKDVRVWPVRGFTNHHLFYRPTEDGIELLYLFHAAQDVLPLLEGDGGGQAADHPDP